MIAILDYGIGNLNSIHNMLKKINVNSIITSDATKIEKAEKFILPGVGSFDNGIKSLKNASFFRTLEKQILKNKKPILGICLGMQLLTNGSEEGKEKGLCWVDASTVKFNSDTKKITIPHMGWGEVEPMNRDNIFKNLKNNRFYFVHSYHVICNEEKNILATTNYYQNFTCSIHKDNIFGVQFHPEKSHKFGMLLLNNFNNINDK